MPDTNLRACFASVEDTDIYFINQDHDQERMREKRREEWAIQNRDFNNIMTEMQDLFRQ